MDILVKDYLSWKKENSHLLHELEHHDASLSLRFKPILAVLDYLVKQNNFDEDSLNIFQAGLNYIRDQFSLVVDYLDIAFKKDVHEMLHYERLINYILEIEALMCDLEDNEIKYDSDALEELIEKVEAIIENKDSIPDTLSIYVDEVVKNSIQDEDYDYISISTIFEEVAETLGIYLYETEEIIIGRDIE